MHLPAIRALIVDDEPLARKGLRLLLDHHDDVDVAGECANGTDAVEAIGALEPDLLFLDVQMPDMNGFEVLDAVGRERVPAIVFVTAYDAYALQAFEVHALDYLLKPFDDERFDAALQRARQAVRQHQEGLLGRRVRALLEAYDGRSADRPPVQPQQPPFLDRLAVKTGGRVQFFKVEEIDWIEAAGDYVCLHVDGKPHYLRETMGRLEERLDPALFARIHRSSIVNINRIRELHGHDSGGYMVLLRDGKQLKMSRSYQNDVLSLLGTVS